MYDIQTRKPGRKPLPESKRRSMLFRFRLTRAEWTAISRAAEQTGESMAALVRRAVLDEARRVRFVAAQMVRGASAKRTGSC